MYLCMHACTHLQLQNRVGMTDELVDSDGYPRQDIDVYQVRHARHRIICELLEEYFNSFKFILISYKMFIGFCYTNMEFTGLQNDHKTLMVKIEQGLHKVHNKSGQRMQDTDSASTVSDFQEMILTEPFLRVNLVSPGSPAELAVKSKFSIRS